MSKFKLAFGIHNHQPVGNFKAVFEEAHKRSYNPFLELTKKYDNFRFSLHQSGILWRWQQETHPEYFELVGGMVDSGQVELLTGGFYEPILISIPERDSKGQIKMLSDYIEKQFEQKADGLWLTERIWEPHLPKMLNESGIKYLPIDDTHFLYSGFEQTHLTGPFITENEGHKVTLLPIQKRLRYLIPFGTVDEVIEELKSQAERNPDGLAVYADDGEKFGVWPNTYEHCFEDGWLEDFFEAISKNSDWLDVIPLGEAAKLKPAGRAYIPSASYAEMLHWALPPTAFLEYEHFEEILTEEKLWERYGRFVRGGHWRNCPYWHGVFGGLYLPHIRQAIYSNLIQADSLISGLDGGRKYSITKTDFIADGHDEVVIESDHFTAVIKPDRGAGLINLALNKHDCDPTDTFTRRKEGYHIKLDRAVTNAIQDKTASIHDIVLAKEEGLKSLLIEDWYQKRCMIDHFFTHDVDFDRFKSCLYGEEGDFILEPFDFKIHEDKHFVEFTRLGHLWRPDGVIALKMIKRYTIDNDSNQILISYELSCPGGERPVVNFGVENNFNFQAGHAEDRFILIDNKRHENCFLDSDGSHAQVGNVSIIDEYRQVGIALTADQPSDIWHLPIYTVSLSEGGFEKVYQGTTVVNKFRLELSESPTFINLRLHAGAVNQIPGGMQTTSAVNS